MEALFHLFYLSFSKTSVDLVDAASVIVEYDNINVFRFFFYAWVVVIIVKISNTVIATIGCCAIVPFSETGVRLHFDILCFGTSYFINQLLKFLIRHRHYISTFLVMFSHNAVLLGNKVTLFF